MGWIDEDGMHEGYFLPLFADGSQGSSLHGDQIEIGVDPEGRKIPIGKRELRSQDEVTGWDLCCNCSFKGSRQYRTVVLARWERVWPPEISDPAARRVATDDPWWIDGDPAVEEAALPVWESHVSPQKAIEAITSAQVATGRASRQLDEAVAAGRAGGLSWADIGRAVGVTRQAARERWGRNEQQDHKIRSMS